MIKSHSRIEMLFKNPMNRKLSSKIKFSRYKYPCKFLYYLQVWIITENNCHKLPEAHRRGKDYSIDHIIPLCAGYASGIPPYIIGDLLNLQIVSSRENLLKNSQINDIVKAKLTEFGIDLNLVKNVVREEIYSGHVNIDKTLIRKRNNEFIKNINR